MEIKIDYDWLDEKLKSIETDLRDADLNSTDGIVGQYLESSRDEINDLRNDIHLMKIKQQESTPT